MRRSHSWFGRAARSITALNIILIILSYVCFIVAGVVALFPFAPRLLVVDVAVKA